MTDWSRRPEAPQPEPSRRPDSGPGDRGPGAPAQPDVAPEASTTTEAGGGDPTVTAATAKTSTDRGNDRPAPRDGDGAQRVKKAGGANLGAVLAALVLGLVLGGFAMTVLGEAGGGDEFGGVIDADRYQAVILSNDKVYFGRIEDVSDEFYRLDDAFFLREQRESAEAEPQRALLPVNREIHAPDNTMLIRKDEVVLVENLAADSPILTEIERQLGDE